MAIQVIGAGFGRTGTLSLKNALEELGFVKCYHMSELINVHPAHIQYWQQAFEGEQVAWSEMFKGYQAIVDFPGSYFYRQLMKQYPEAKVILTIRDSEAWYDSARETIAKTTPGFRKMLLTSLKLPFSAHLRNRMKVFRFSDVTWDELFHGRFDDKAYAINVFERRNEAIKEYVPSEKLLVYEVTQGWQPLCTFLDVPVPAGTPFPHLHERGQFGQE